MDERDYIIRGGAEGRERLRILSRVMRPSTHALLRRAGIHAGMKCLDVGCGGGDVAFDMANMVGPGGHVDGTDIDQEKLDLARLEAAELALSNIEFQREDITQDDLVGEFDFIHARFVLTHLVHPSAVLAKLRKVLRPGGAIVIEDIDFRGCFCHPDCRAFWRYVELYTEAVKRKGADANIGPRLPSLLSEAGFENVQVNVVQPAGTEGEVKLITPITMENIADSVVSEGLATAAEVKQVVAELWEYARTPGTVGSLPRIVEAWGYQAGSFVGRELSSS